MLCEHEERDGYRQIPERHANGGRGTALPRVSRPVGHPDLRPADETPHRGEPVNCPKNPVDLAWYGKQCDDEEHDEGEGVEQPLNVLREVGEGWLPHQRVGEAGEVGERRRREERPQYVHQAYSFSGGLRVLWRGDR